MSKFASIKTNRRDPKKNARNAIRGEVRRQERRERAWSILMKSNPAEVAKQQNAFALAEVRRQKAKQAKKAILSGAA